MSFPPHFIETPDGLTHDLFQIVDEHWWAICGVELEPGAGYDSADGRTRCESCEGLRAAEEHEEPVAPTTRARKASRKRKDG